MRDSLFIGYKMAGSLRKSVNRSLLDKEVEEDLGSVSEIYVFPLGPDHAIRLLPDGRRGISWCVDFPPFTIGFSLI